MATTSSPMELKEPRRKARVVSCANQVWTRFSQLELVGVKWRWKRGLVRQPGDFGMVVGAVVVQDQVQIKVWGDSPGRFDAGS
jgi:hypothetical protein